MNAFGDISTINLALLKEQTNYVCLFSYKDTDLVSLGYGHTSPPFRCVSVGVARALECSLTFCV